MIRFENITFGYRRRQPLLHDLSWNPKEGRTVLLGPNGAGKSTLLSLGAGALRPWQGAVHLDTTSPFSRSSRRQYLQEVAWMPQEVKALQGVSVREQVAYHAWLKGLTRSDSWDESKRMLGRVGLDQNMDKMMSALSGGQKRRVGLAQALVANPRVLLLDEPTVGLDPAQRARFRQVLSEVIEGGRASVIVSTHQVDDLTDVFDHVAVINRGALRFDGSVSDFLSLTTTTGSVTERVEASYTAVGDMDA